MDTITLIVPCYNEEAALRPFYDEVCRVAAQMNSQRFELLFIDDGSTDNTLALIRSLRAADSRVRYLSFSRNFGKEAALFAGLQHASGDFVAVLDADLQHPPALLPEMYEKLQNAGCDSVAARRVTRAGESRLRSFCARRFYRMIQRLSRTQIPDGATDYRLMSRRMVDAILSLGEYNRFSKGIFSWVGFQTEWITYENVERVAGDTKWSLWSLLVYALDGICAFSTLPLIISSLLGMVFTAVAVVMILVIVIKTLIFGDPVAGYPSMVCFMFFIGGIQLFCIGILGQYLSKLYLEVKKRPIYIIAASERDEAKA